jgi:diketogulonate reductase-like aldo/keto reductase
MTGPTLKLHNGVDLPALGLGVYQSGPNETVAAVQVALSNGYRMIDTAAAYFNEEHVGRALGETDIPRDEIFVQTKLWISDYGFDKALHAFDRSMGKLDLETLDLYLLHWPVPKEIDLTVESWKALIRLQEEGRVRAIGICNASMTDLSALIEATGVVPTVNQVELHPYLAQPGLRKAGADLGIVTQAWSPIGGVKRYHGPGAETDDPLRDPVIVGLAEKHCKAPAQIILRWQIEHGNSIIPKSVRPERIRENGDIFDFTLSAEEVASVDALDRAERGGPDPAKVRQSLFNLVIED